MQNHFFTQTFYSSILLFKHSDNASIALIFFSALEELSATVARTFSSKRIQVSLASSQKFTKRCCSY